MIHKIQYFSIRIHLLHITCLFLNVKEDFCFKFKHEEMLIIDHIKRTSKSYFPDFILESQATCIILTWTYSMGFKHDVSAKFKYETQLRSTNNKKISKNN